MSEPGKEDRPQLAASLSMQPVESMTTAAAGLVASFLNGLFREVHSRRLATRIYVGVSELLTNVLQHATVRDGEVNLNLHLQPDCLSVKVQNRASIEEYEKVQAIVEALAASESPQALFVRTLRDRRDHHQEGGLGLIRLVVECKFQLAIQYSDDLLTIEAKLPLGDP